MSPLTMQQDHTTWIIESTVAFSNFTKAFIEFNFRVTEKIFFKENLTLL